MAREHTKAESNYIRELTAQRDEAQAQVGALRAALKMAADDWLRDCEMFHSEEFEDDYGQVYAALDDTAAAADAHDERVRQEGFKEGVKHFGSDDYAAAVRKAALEEAAELAEHRHGNPTLRDEILALAEEEVE